MKMHEYMTMRMTMTMKTTKSGTDAVTVRGKERKKRMIWDKGRLPGNTGLTDDKERKKQEYYRMCRELMKPEWHSLSEEPMNDRRKENVIV